MQSVSSRIWTSFPPTMTITPRATVITIYMSNYYLYDWYLFGFYYLYISYNYSCFLALFILQIVVSYSFMAVNIYTSLIIFCMPRILYLLLFFMYLLLFIRLLLLICNLSLFIYLLSLFIRMLLFIWLLIISVSLVSADILMLLNFNGS